ncbi:MAG: Na/Pi symporter, partial [Prevotellaceae bacterium]|nr:Na/Pi symporter [Prevotellaceae bacterium]
MTVWTLFKLIGSLALLMYGMKSMSESLQKMAGPQLRHVLQAMTKNRFIGTVTGAFVTASVQSSTATTVMTVSFVNAGLLTLAQAISIIMGANIGTTFTAWIMSAGFSFNITDFVWPAFFIGILLIYSKKRKIVGDFLFGVSFLLLGLGTLKATGSSIDFTQYPAVMNFFSSFGDNYGSYLLFLFIGGVLTFCVQSSAAIMAITMTLCGTGVLPIYLGIALVMGENIGTTITSNIAALTANTPARRAAFAHLFFNCFGVVWMLIVFKPFINAVCNLWGYPTGADATPEALAANSLLLPFILATFHTGFNIINTAILIWFVPVIEKIACTVISGKKNAKGEEEEEEGKLKFISGGILATPELSVLNARKEIQLF